MACAKTRKENKLGELRKMRMVMPIRSPEY